MTSPQSGLFALLAAAALMAPVATEAGVSDWSESFNARMRLLSADGKPTAAGTYLAGVEIALEPGWKTYWRQPGESGLPPEFDFSRSENLAAATVRYPVPKRIAEGGSVSVGYDVSPLLPVEVMPTDPATPVRLVVDVQYGVCKNICVPAEGSAELTIEPGSAGDIVAAIPLRQAIKTVPAAPGADGLRILSVERDRTAAPAMLDIRLSAVDLAAPVDLFVEGPAGWYLPLAEPVAGDPTRFHLELDGLPPGAAIDGAELVLTAVNGAKAVEQKWHLD
ncbi:MAG: hypothetical protein KDJ16_16975 [Hyphomicrobiales bacterium]|nr:hypothetical protein [Hyphomicrobiales bacterium]